MCRNLQPISQFNMAARRLRYSGKDYSEWDSGGISCVRICHCLRRLNHETGQQVYENSTIHGTSCRVMSRRRWRRFATVRYNDERHMSLDLSPSPVCSSVPTPLKNVVCETCHWSSSVSLAPSLLQLLGLLNSSSAAVRWAIFYHISITK